jgi:hypothetical protein
MRKLLGILLKREKKKKQFSFKNMSNVLAFDIILSVDK